MSAQMDVLARAVERLRAPHPDHAQDAANNEAAIALHEWGAAVAELIEAAAARLKEGSGQMTEAEHRLSNAIALVIGNRLPGNAGWVLVPPEPTEVMLNAALKLQGDDAFLARAPAVLSAFVKIYKAMIANVGGAK